MIKNYNVLSGSRDTRLKKRSVIDVDFSPTSITTKSKMPSEYAGWLIAFLLLFGFGANAQVTSYDFSQSNGTYAPISGGINNVSTCVVSIDDTSYAALPIGFTFSYDATPYTTFGINANGWIIPG